MSIEALSIVGLVVVLLPTFYFLIVTPTFLLAKFEDPIVARLFRGLLSFHFQLVSIASVIGFFAFAISGRLVVSLCLGMVGTLALYIRHWFLRRIDHERTMLMASTVNAAQNLRVLHKRAMAYNFVQCAVLLSLIPENFAK